MASPADVALRAGLRVDAAAHVSEILDQFDADTAVLQDEPAWMLMVCYRVLRASGDDRSHEHLGEAYRWLREQAARITDE